MTEYLLIESRSPAESGQLAQAHALAADLAGRGDKVTIYLVQNAVLAARQGAGSGGLDVALCAGVEVLADDFSLRERGIEAGDLWAGVRPASIETLVDLTVRSDAKTVWH